MSAFPEGYFFIRNVASGKVLDVADNSKMPGGRVVLWGRKPAGNENQLWRYEDGFLVNKGSGLVLEVPGYEHGGDITPGTPLVQAERRQKPESLNQLWAYNYQHIMPYDPKVTVWGQDGDVTTPGTRAVVDRYIHDEVSQEWMCDMA